jgi:hypothetical protein
MDIKKSLYTYMINSPGSFVGFFELVSEVLKDLGDDWVKHSETDKDQLEKEWGGILLHTSTMVKGVSEALGKIRTEFDKRESNRKLEDFKEKVATITAPQN